MIKVYRLVNGDDYELLFAVDESTAEVYGDSAEADKIRGTMQWTRDKGLDPTNDTIMEKYKELIAKKYRGGHYITRYD